MIVGSGDDGRGLVQHLLDDDDGDDDVDDDDDVDVEVVDDDGRGLVQHLRNSTFYHHNL